MIRCHVCNAQNEDHYKFCLACGSKLTEQAENEHVEEADQVEDVPETKEPNFGRTERLSERPGLIPAVKPLMDAAVADDANFESVQLSQNPDITTVEPQSGFVEGHSMSSLEGDTNDEIEKLQVRAQEKVKFATSDTVDGDSIFEQTGMDSDHTAVMTEAPDMSGNVQKFCLECGAGLPPGYRFCGSCGTPIPEAKQPVANKAVVLMGYLVFIHPNGEDGDRLPLEGKECVLGRDSTSELLKNDPHLSPRHVRIRREGDRLVVSDLDSFNGVYTRLKKRVQLKHGTMFRIGQQLFLFEAQDQRTPDRPQTGEGVMVFGSSGEGSWGRLSSVCAPNVFSDQWMLSTPEIYLGREKGTIIFPEDVFISGTHCKVTKSSHGYFLEDLGSTNGTYVRTEGDFSVGHGDFLLLGQQLFRLECKD